MPQDNNQPNTASLDKDQLKNFTFITETLEKLGMGKVFDQVLRTGMLAGDPVIEKAAKFTFENPDGMARVTPRFERTEGDLGGHFYLLKGFRESLLDKEGKETVSQFLPVFKKTGFTVEEGRNLLEGRAVLNRVFPMDGDPYTRYTRINFDEKTENGNFKLDNRNAANLDFDLAKGLSAIPFARSLTQQEKEDVGRKLEKGYEHIFQKRGPNNSFERMRLYAIPHEGQLATVDSNGELKTYPANRVNMRAVGVLEETSQQTQGQPDRKNLDKAAETAQKMEEGQGKDQKPGQRKKAA